MKDWSATPSTPLAYFRALVRGDDMPLLEAAASIAQDAHPQLDVQAFLADMDRLLERLRRRIAADAGPLQRLGLLQQFFYRELGFCGNANDFLAPHNSYLHEVLRQRRGVPISLAVLWLELAHGVGLAAQGIAFPGHFLLEVRLAQGYVLLDPLTGATLAREDVAEWLTPFLRQQGQGLDEEILWQLFLRAAEPRVIVARMLRNLQEIHRAQAEHVLLAAVCDRLLELEPEDWSVWRERGLANAALGQADAALADLQTYLDHAGDAEDAPAIQRQLAALRGQSGAGRFSWP